MAEETTNTESTTEKPPIDTQTDGTKTTETTTEKKTIANGAENNTSAPPTFPEQWRKELAGDDEKTVKRLERFGSPKDLAKSYMELEAKLSSGQTKPSLAANATPEQISEYRRQIGVPESADKYDLTLSNGLVIGDTDKPLVDSYLTYALEKNLPNDVVKANLEWYLPMAKEAEQQRAEEDRSYQINSEEVLRKEWGGDYKANINIISGLLETVPSEIQDILMFGRTADGKIIGDDPRMLKLISNWGREINPVQTVVPNAGAAAPQMIASEIAALTKQMGDKNSDYWSKDKGPALQARFRELSEADERIKKKA